MGTEIPTQIAPKEFKTPSKLRKWLKRIGWTVLGVLVVLWAIGTFARGAVDKFDSRFFVNWVMERRQVAYDKEIEKVRDLYRNDFDGGKTPEETLDLLIEALKVGDMEKASRYYELRMQSRAFERLRDEMVSQEGFNKHISYLVALKKEGKKSCYKDYNYGGANGCAFSREYITTETSTSTFRVSGQNIVLVTPSGSKDTDSVSFVENSYTYVWKVVPNY